MSKSDWYTNSIWDSEEQALFFSKIKRARYQKAFYLRAKGSTLLYSGEEAKIRAALELFRFALNECPESDLVSSFYLQSARAAVLLNLKTEALGFFQKAIEVQEDPNTFVRINNVWRDFILFIIKEELEDYYEEVLGRLAQEFSERELFLRHGFRAIILHRQGKRAEAQAEREQAEDIERTQEQQESKESELLRSLL